jgi:hypothetical protein
MAITGVHALLYTSEPEAVRGILRDAFGWPAIEAGGDWLIFKLPPAELGVHPGAGPTFDSGVRHELSLMCDDLESTIADLRSKGVEIGDDREQAGWGVTATIELPGDLRLLLYEPRHPTAI